jgi:hypothetical protein
MFAYVALENLLKENQISHEEYEKLEQLVCLKVKVCVSKSESQCV